MPVWPRPGLQLKLVAHIVDRDKEVVGPASLQQAELQLSLGRFKSAGCLLLVLRSPDALVMHDACC